MPGPFIVRNSDVTLEGNQKHSFFVTNSQLYKTRLIILVLVVAHITWRIARAKSHYFYFLTNWNWLINLLYFSIVVLLTTKPSPKPYTKNLVFKYFYSSSVCLSWIVTIVYWALLSEELFTDISVELKIVGTLSHILNIVFPMIDLFCKILVLIPSKQGNRPFIMGIRANHAICPLHVHGPHVTIF